MKNLMLAVCLLGYIGSAHTITLDYSINFEQQWTLDGYDTRHYTGSVIQWDTDLDWLPWGYDNIILEINGSEEYVSDFGDSLALGLDLYEADDLGRLTGVNAMFRSVWGYNNRVEMLDGQYREYWGLSTDRLISYGSYTLEQLTPWPEEPPPEEPPPEEPPPFPDDLPIVVSAPLSQDEWGPMLVIIKHMLKEQ